MGRRVEKQQLSDAEPQHVCAARGLRAAAACSRQRVDDAIDLAETAQRRRHQQAREGPVARRRAAQRSGSFSKRIVERHAAARGRPAAARRTRAAPAGPTGRGRRGLALKEDALARRAYPQGPRARAERSAGQRRSACSAPPICARHLLQPADAVLRARMGARTGRRRPAPCSGLMMNRCAVAGLASASDCRSAAPRCKSWRAPRRATAAGRRSAAPTRSASYSRERLMAICTSMAAIGATIMASSTPIDAERIVALSRLPPKKKAKLRQHADGAGQGRGDRHGQRVAVAHMRQLVRDDAGDLLLIQALQQAGRHGDGGVLRIAAGGEGVGLRRLHDDRRAASAGRRAAPARCTMAIELRRAGARRPPGRRACAAPACRNSSRRRRSCPARSPSDQHAALAADQIADGQEQTRSSRPTAGRCGSSSSLGQSPSPGRQFPHGA